MSQSLATLFDDAGALGGERRALEGGTRLFSAGEPADAVYLLRSGLLAVVQTLGGRRHVVGLIRAGEIVGEMGVLNGAVRNADVGAVRDSVVDMLPPQAFLDAAARDPAAMAEIARLLARRMRADRPKRPRAHVVLIAPPGPGADATSLACRLAEAARGLGARAVALSPRDADQGVAGIEAAEAVSDLVLLATHPDETEWTMLCRRQADRILLHGSLHAQPPSDCGPGASEPLRENQLIDLVLERSQTSGRQGIHHWLTATGAARVFHIDATAPSVTRLARILTGRSVGLVLSGGGARAFAHVGTVRALREAGVPIDLVAGTSMGAIVAAGVASGWDDAELGARMQEAFVVSSPLDDIAFPFVAMTRGKKVEQRLARHFGETDIADLDLPFFCVSANLTAGRTECHDSGRLARALRASISLPGILPPVVEAGQVLVDGGVLRNLPTDIMRARHEGTVIGSDVTHVYGVGPADVEPPPSWLRWFASGAWRRGPPIVSILMSSATAAAGAEIALARDSTDLYITPDTSGVEIRNWQAYPAAVEAGYRATREALARLEAPATELRRRHAAEQAGSF